MTATRNLSVFTSQMKANLSLFPSPPPLPPLCVHQLLEFLYGGPYTIKCIMRATRNLSVFSCQMKANLSLLPSPPLPLPFSLSVFTNYLIFFNAAQTLLQI